MKYLSFIDRELPLILGERQKSGKIHAHTPDFEDMQRERSTGPFCLLFVSPCQRGKKHEGQGYLNKEDGRYRTINSWLYPSTLVNFRYHMFNIFRYFYSCRKAKAINIRKFQHVGLLCSEHKLVRKLLNVRRYKSLRISMNLVSLILQVSSLQWQTGLYIEDALRVSWIWGGIVKYCVTSIENSECFIMEGISLL